MTEYYFLKKDNEEFTYSKAHLLENPEELKLIAHPIKLKILKLLTDKPLYAIEIAKELVMHEQNVYYHLNQLVRAGVLDVVEKKEIRGTTAKRYAPKSPNIGISLKSEFKELTQLYQKKKNPLLNKFFDSFVYENELHAQIVIGSPDPHGPHKARARDGHYAIEIGLFLGQFISTLNRFSTCLDVTIDLTKSKNLIVIGGPVTNLVASKINEHSLAKFNDKKPWGIITTIEKYTEESVGMISRFKNPWNKEGWILWIAGVGNSGTKSAVLGIITHYNAILESFKGQDVWFKIVQGFDLDGDGEIDSVEILE